MTSTSGPRAPSFLQIEDLSTERIEKLFSRASEIKEGSWNQSLQGRQIVMLFSEASTRTKMSFQMAAQRLGAQCLVLDDALKSSQSKGESFSDTFWTMHSLRPDGFIIRCNGSEPLSELAEASQCPVINAGFGSFSHPTQALLDVFTMKEHFSSLEGVKVLFVGDICHSRVAQSHFKLLPRYQARVGVCGPENFLKGVEGDVTSFHQIEDALQWADVFVGLRVQLERHEDPVGFDRGEYVQKFTLDEKRLKILSKEALIMHPGPVNWGVEFQPEVGNDSRFLMWKQKENGVYTRAALMEMFFVEKL